MSDVVEKTPPPSPGRPTAEQSASRGAERTVDTADFFPEVGDDLSQITWRHRVNSAAHLEESLADQAIMMLEADIIAGRLEGEEDSSPLRPIMAHPLQDTPSDLSPSVWLKKVIAANMAGQRKGVKLNFKEQSVVEEVLRDLKGRREEITFPVWLSADILPGPGACADPPLDPEKFLPLCAEYFPQATLSLGWSTGSSGAEEPVVGYSRPQLEEMVAALERHAVTQSITFSMRASLLGSSLEDLEWLLDTVPDSSLMVWSIPEDTIDPVALVALKETLGSDATYFDLPAEQRRALDEAVTKQEEEEENAVSCKASSHKCPFLPDNASLWAYAGLAVASALAALYLYD